VCHVVFGVPCCAVLQVAIVGKGLTFDSGGYNLKAGPGSMIELMKVRASSSSSSSSTRAS
jgi:leucyl aminopeptidase